MHNPTDRIATYHCLWYTSHGALAGMRNSSMGPPHVGSIQRPIALWANALTTELHLALKWQKFILLLYIKCLMPILPLRKMELTISNWINTNYLNVDIMCVCLDTTIISPTEPLPPPPLHIPKKTHSNEKQISKKNYFTWQGVNYTIAFSIYLTSLHHFIPND